MADAPRGTMSESLFTALLLSMPVGTVVKTLKGERPNRISALTADAVWVETDKTDAEGTGAQEVPGPAPPRPSNRNAERTGTSTACPVGFVPLVVPELEAADTYRRPFVASNQ